MAVVFPISRGLSAQSLTRMSDGIAGTYIFPESAGGVVTASSGMTVAVSAIAAGVTINGTVETSAYAGGTVTADAADATNPRRDLVYYDQSGAVGIKNGTPTAVTTTTGPALPVLDDDEIAVAELYIAKDAVVINTADISDRRQDIVAPLAAWTLVGYSATGGTTTSTAAVDLLTISGLSIPVTAPVRIMGNYSKDASAAQIVGLGLKINSTVVIEASNSQNFARSSGTQRAEDGFFDFTFGPRSTSYLGGNGQGTAQTKVSSTGANAQTPYLMGGVLTNLYPNAEITSITLRGINVTASNNLAVKDVFIFQGPTL
jgi:hypothetical protein